MRHSIISWDCSFRNFFHLITALASQDFDKKEYELIFVEQRSQHHADAYNHNENLPSLSDLQQQYKNRFDLKCYYLNDSTNIPYALSKINNYGISQASGDIISVMDGDMLLPENFLQSLSAYHNSGERIVNLHRLNAAYPVGVKTFTAWKAATIDYKKTLRASPRGLAKLPDFVDNIGPMISAKRAYWDMVEGYDESPIFATSASKAGLDTCTRLSIAAKVKNTVLPGMVAAHPWHPIGYAHAARIQIDKYVQKYYHMQDKLIEFSVKMNLSSWRDRKRYFEDMLCQDADKTIAVVHAASLEHESRELCVPRGMKAYFATVLKTSWERQKLRPFAQWTKSHLRRGISFLQG